MARVSFSASNFSCDSNIGDIIFSNFSNISSLGITNSNDFIKAPEASLNVEPVAFDSMFSVFESKK